MYYLLTQTSNLLEQILPYPLEDPAHQHSFRVSPSLPFFSQLLLHLLHSITRQASEIFSDDLGVLAELLSDQTLVRDHLHHVHLARGREVFLCREVHFGSPRVACEVIAGSIRTPYTLHPALGGGGGGNKERKEVMKWVESFEPQ